MNKILFFNHYVISPLHWFSLPIRDKISALKRRMGLTSPDNADASAPGPNVGEDHRELLKNLDYAVYSLSACLYALKPFSFPATVYFPEDSTSRRIKRVTNKYPTFTVDMVPGNHQTCISKHAEDLAVKMKQALGNIH